MELQRDDFKVAQDLKQPQGTTKEDMGMHPPSSGMTVHEFKQPQGTAKEDIDASGDGEVPAVLHLKPDDSLVEQGLAREVINRVQKLRKQAGLVAIDVVDVFVEVPADAGDAGQQLQQVLASQGEYITQTIGRSVQPGSARQSHAVVIAKSREQVGSDKTACSFDVLLTRPCLHIDHAALAQLSKDDKDLAEGAAIWLASCDADNLQKRLAENGNTVTVTINKQQLSLQAGKHFQLPRTGR